MQRDLLLLRQMIDAAEQARTLVAGRSVAETKARFPDIPWRNRYWSVDIGVLHTTATEQLGDFTARLCEAQGLLAADDPGSG